jgi:hypothetical protein
LIKKTIRIRIKNSCRMDLVLSLICIIKWEAFQNTKLQLCWRVPHMQTQIYTLQNSGSTQTHTLAMMTPKHIQHYNPCLHGKLSAAGLMLCAPSSIYMRVCIICDNEQSWLGSIIIAGALPTWLALYTHMRHTNIHVFASAHPNTNTHTHTQPTSSSAQGKKPLGDDTSPATNQPRYMYNNIAPVYVYHHRHVAQ